MSASNGKKGFFESEPGRRSSSRFMTVVFAISSILLGYISVITFDPVHSVNVMNHPGVVLSISQAVIAVGGKAFIDFAKGFNQKFGVEK